MSPPRDAQATQHDRLGRERRNTGFDRKSYGRRVILRAKRATCSGEHRKRSGRHGTRRRKEFTGVAPLQTAGQDEVSFLDNRRDAAAFEQTRAGAVIVHPQMQARVPSSTIAIITASAYEGWARVAGLFHPLPPLRPGIHPSALVDPGARCTHPPKLVLTRSLKLEPRSVLVAVLARFVSIGSAVAVGPCQLRSPLLGSRVYIYPGARIGQEGFRWPWRLICALAKAARSVRRPGLSLTSLLARYCWGVPRNRTRNFSGTWPHCNGWPRRPE